MNSQGAAGEVVEIKMDEGRIITRGNTTRHINNFMVTVSTISHEQETYPAVPETDSSARENDTTKSIQHNSPLSKQSTVATTDEDTFDTKKNDGVIECLCAVCFNFVVCGEPSCSPPCDEPGECNFNCPISRDIGEVYYHGCIFCSVCCCGWCFTIPLNMYCFYQLKICEICFWPSAVRRARRNRINFQL
jgi:hypothetical protein